MAAGTFGYVTWKGTKRRGYARSGTAFAKRVERRKQRRAGRALVRAGLLEERVRLAPDFFDLIGVHLYPWQRELLVLITSHKTTWTSRPRA